MAKERYQNPAIGDDVNLKIFTYNSNNLTNVSSVEKVDIYFLDPSERSSSNPDGRRLVESFDGDAVVINDTGAYTLTINLESVRYTIGTYLDVWTLNVIDNEPASTSEHVFKVYSNLWYTTPIPIVYDFSFSFQPNKFRKGSKQFLIIQIKPNVPTAGDLRAYYEHVAVTADLKVSIEQKCGDCMPEEQDLRLIVDREPIDHREKAHGYYKIDTEDMPTGIYDVWFQLDFAENRYISDRQQFQIYD